MCKTSITIWDNKKAIRLTDGLFLFSQFMNRESIFFALALANLKGLPKLKTLNPSPTILNGINKVLCVHLP